MPIWHIKLERNSQDAARIHGAWNPYALERLKQQTSYPSEYPDHADIHEAAGNAGKQQRVATKSRGNGEKI